MVGHLQTQLLGEFVPLSLFYGDVPRCAPAQMVPDVGKAGWCQWRRGHRHRLVIVEAWAVRRLYAALPELHLGYGARGSVEPANHELEAINCPDKLNKSTDYLVGGFNPSEKY